MADPRERIEEVLDFPTSFDAPTFDKWKRTMADAILEALGLERHERTMFELYNAEEQAYRMSLSSYDVRSIDEARERMAPYHHDGDGYEVIERRQVWWSTSSTWTHLP